MSAGRKLPDDSKSVGPHHTETTAAPWTYGIIDALDLSEISYRGPTTVNKKGVGRG